MLENAAESPASNVCVYASVGNLLALSDYCMEQYQPLKVLSGKNPVSLSSRCNVV